MLAKLGRLNHPCAVSSGSPIFSSGSVPPHRDHRYTISSLLKVPEPETLSYSGRGTQCRSCFHLRPLSVNIRRRRRHILGLLHKLHVSAFKMTRMWQGLM